jgi:hypothetical protein
MNMTTRAAINILGSSGEIIDVTSLGVSEITSSYSDGVYRVVGTLGMAPPPMGWGYVVNQADLDKTISIEYAENELRVTVENEKVPVKLAHSITLHVLVEELPPVEMSLSNQPAEKTSELMSEVDAEYMRLRAIADFKVAPLQDAVDVDEATEENVTLLKAWKKYRVALNRVIDQSGYPNKIDWPVAPE